MKLITGSGLVLFVVALGIVTIALVVINSDMLMLMIKESVSPFFIAVFVAATILSLYCAIALAHSRGEVPPSRLGIWIAGIPLIAGLLPLAAFVYHFSFMVWIRIFIWNQSGTGDPRVIAMGTSRTLEEDVITVGIFLCFLTVWLVLREKYRRVRENIV